MNKKGMLFSIDVIISLALSIFLIGSIFAIYHFEVNNYVNNYNNSELLMGQNVVLNNLAISSNSCRLVDDSGDIIKYISFCLDSSKTIDVDSFAPSDINVRIECVGDCPHIENNAIISGEYIAKDISLFSNDGDISKQDYFNSLDSSAPMESVEVRVYVSRK